MNSIAKWMMTAGLIGAATAASAQVTYDVNNLQFGSSNEFLSGTITLSNSAANGGPISNSSFSAIDLSVFTGKADTTALETFNDSLIFCINTCLTVTSAGLAIGPFGDEGESALNIDNGSKGGQLLIGVGFGGIEYSSSGSAVPLTGSQIFATPAPASPPVAAPEIDPASAAGGITLLAGLLAIFRGRRPQRLALPG